MEYQGFSQAQRLTRVLQVALEAYHPDAESATLPYPSPLGGAFEYKARRLPAAPDINEKRRHIGQGLNGKSTNNAPGLYHVSLKPYS